jgi:hypothetical protein
MLCQGVVDGDYVLYLDAGFIFVSDDLQAFVQQMQLADLDAGYFYDGLVFVPEDISSIAHDWTKADTFEAMVGASPDSSFGNSKQLLAGIQVDGPTNLRLDSSGLFFQSRPR